LIFVVCILLLATTAFLRLLRPLVQRLLWRVRTRLLVTYCLIGAVPMVLLLIFVSLASYLVLAQTVNYLVHIAIERQLDELQSTAERMAEAFRAGREGAGILSPSEVAIIRREGKASSDFPEWSTPGFKGIVANAAGDHFFSAHAAAGSGRERVEVFASRKMDNAALAQLASGLASLEVITAQRMVIAVGQRRATNVKVVLDSEEAVPGPVRRGFWDADLQTPLPVTVRSLDTGSTTPEVVEISSRPSAILATVFSTLGRIATVVAVSLLVIACVFLLVELVAILFSAGLSRSITRVVHDLYLGTKKVEAGDFSHRIPVRSKDQLSDLASSFNSMTQRVEQLIAELKEKEKLEAELEIARQVQTQLFPKHPPALKTLQLAGVCNPARVVSGDYYDFITVDAVHVALVIGDISGKGISAALLMASMQSSLHAQLAMNSSEAVSISALVSRLNRQLYENSPPEKYATFYCGMYDDEKGQLIYTNAGHLAPILIRGGKVIRMESNGMAVGMFPDAPYVQNAIDLQPGDLFTAFTDGITESENGQGEEFGDGRLIELLLSNCEKPLDEIVKIVSRAVRDWAYDLANQDDTTMLLARRV